LILATEFSVVVTLTQSMHVERNHFHCILPPDTQIRAIEAAS